MAINLRPPSQGIGSTEDKLRSLYSYLYQLTEELNQALTTVGSSGRDGISKVLSGGGGSGGSKVDKSTAEAYQQLKSLIIKTATDVTSNMRRIVTEMSADYRASSEYGDYYEYLKRVTTESARGYTMEWDNENGITTNVADFAEYKANSEVYMQLGIVGENMDGTVEAGVVIGRELQKVTVDGEETIVSENVYSVLTADRLSFWQNGANFAYVSLTDFFVEKAYIGEVTTELIQSKEKGAALALNEGLLQGIANNIDLAANNSIRLAVSNSVQALGMTGDNLLKKSGETITSSSGVVARYDFGDIKPIKGETYTVRLWIESASGSMPAISAYGLGPDGYNPGWGKPTEAEDGSYVYTGEWKMDDVIGFAISQPFTDRKTLTIHRIKLERGDKPTAWIPHREEFKAGTTLEMDEDGLKMTGGEISMITRDDDGNQTGAVIIDKRGVNATGGEIKMITKDDEGNDTGAVVIDRDGVLATGGKIEMQSIEDGEVVGNVTMDPKGFRAQGVAISLSTGDEDSAEYINITDDGVAASSVSAPNVAVRYNGPSVITVQSGLADNEYESGAYVRTIAEVISKLNGRVVDDDVLIYLVPDYRQKQYGDILISGITGMGSLKITSMLSVANSTIVGKITVKNCAVPVDLEWLDIFGSDYVVKAIRADVKLISCMLTTTLSEDIQTMGVVAERGAVVNDQSSKIYGTWWPYWAADGSSISARMSVIDWQVVAEGGTIYLYNISFTGSEDEWNPIIRAGAVHEMATMFTADIGDVDPTPTLPTTVEVALTEGKSYSYTDKKWIGDDKIRQGLYGSDNYVGCMWFDKSDFSGKTLAGATLTLTRVNRTGRGSEVTLHLYAISATSTGDPTSGFVDCGVIGKIGSGETRSFSILEAAQRLATGGYIGFALFEAGATKMSGQEYSSNYCRIDSSSPKLTVTY